MRIKLERQTKHRGTNTHTFKGFTEKVRALRVSARTYLLQRPGAHDDDGDSAYTHFYQALLRARELNLTQDFQDFQNEVGSEIQTTAQLVLREGHVAECLARHLKRLDTMALHPLLNLLVAFANDLPQEYYNNHFYAFLPILMQCLKTKVPEDIEAVFVCLVSLFVTQHKALHKDIHRLYHTEGYAKLLDRSRPWYINELAAQSLTFLLRKLPDKDVFLHLAFRKLRADEGQMQGVGRLLAAMMRSDVIQRLHSSTADTLKHILKLLGDKELPLSAMVESVKFAAVQLAHHITTKHTDKSILWQTGWKEDCAMVWPVFWEVIDSLLPDISSSSSSQTKAQHLHAILQVLHVLLFFKKGALVTDFPDTLTYCLKVAQTPNLSEEVGETLFDTISGLLTSPQHQTTTATLNKVLSGLLASHFSHKIKLAFFSKLFNMPRFDTEILPSMLQYLHTIIADRDKEGMSLVRGVRGEEMEVGKRNKDLEMDVVRILASLVLHKQPPCKTGMDLEAWQRYPLDFTLALARSGGRNIIPKPVKGREGGDRGEDIAERREGRDRSTPKQVEREGGGCGGIPKLIERRFKVGLKEDLSNIEELLLCLFSLPHLSPLDHQDLAPHLSWVLSDLLEHLKDCTQKVVEDDSVKMMKKKSKKKSKKYVESDSNILTSESDVLENLIDDTEEVVEDILIKVTKKKQKKKRGKAVDSTSDPDKPSRCSDVMQDVSGHTEKADKDSVKATKEKSKKKGKKSLDSTIDSNKPNTNSSMIPKSDKKGKKVMDAASDSNKIRSDPNKLSADSKKPATVLEKLSNDSSIDSSAVPSIDLNIKQYIPVDKRRCAVLLGCVVEAMAVVLSGEDFLAILSNLQLLELLKHQPQYRENTHFLRALSFHLTLAAREKDPAIFTKEFLRMLYPLLAPCLASADPQVRLLVVHMLSLFPVSMPIPSENTEAPDSIFQIMLMAEKVPTTPWQYKDRLRYLTNIDADHVGPHQPICGTYTLAPLLMLLGQLYINYKDIWPPILKAVASYANALPNQLFWPLWFSHLKITSHITQEVLHGKADNTNEVLFPTSMMISEVIHSLTTHEGFSQVPVKPDILNYRDLLWNAMEKFSEVCEARNRDLVPLFFDFLEQELFPVDYTIAPTQDLKLVRYESEAEMTQGGDFDRPSDATDKTEDAAHKVENALIKTDDASDKTEDPGGKQSTEKHPPGEHEKVEDRTAPRRAPIKSLCAQLSLFAKFHNPRMLNQTRRLENMYLELLSHPSPVLQKLSFDCLLTYNPPFLLPYKDNLYKILDDKSFKNALTLFSIDGSEQLVQEDHREGLMPYLMRILYGKMHFKTGSNSSGKSKILVRKATILRFLAGARESELTAFLELAFDVLITHLKGPALKVVTRARKNLDLSRVVPLSRMQGALTTLDNIIEKIGNLLSDKVPFLLKIMLYILMVVSTVLEHRADVSDRSVSFLKHLRQQAQRQLLAFFKRFIDYNWSLDELDAVFEAMVWPNLQRLPDEGVASPVPLLQLFLFWSASPHYTTLLARHHPADTTLTPLPYVIKLLAHHKCSQHVSDMVLTMVENLLTQDQTQAGARLTEGEGLEKTSQPLPDSPHTLPVVRKTNHGGSREQSFGAAMLTPHLDPLLASMQQLLSRLGKGQAVTSREMTILTNLTEWADGKAVSADLVELILPLVVKRHVRKEEKLMQLLTTCSHLLPNIDTCLQYLHPLISQFATLAGRHSREALCKCVEAVASCHPRYQPVAEIATDLNAWNLRMVDEVDYERRLGCYQRLSQYFTTQDTIEVNLCHVVMYNSVYFLCHATDSSLRDVASLCLTQLVDYCSCLQSKCPKEFKEVVADKFLPRLRPLLRNDKEAVRMEALAVLRHTVIKCHTKIDKLSDLHKLVDEVDSDRDFFLNSKHIQRHRRARALSKLSDKLSSGELTFTADTLNDYLTPLATVYLFKDTYSSDEYLIKSCIACLGSIARQLPWYPYQRLLRTYLSLVMKEDLKHLKQSVRIIDEVLDAFHEEVEVCEDEGMMIQADKTGHDEEKIETQMSNENKDEAQKEGKSVEEGGKKEKENKMEEEDKERSGDKDEERIEEAEEEEEKRDKEEEGEKARSGEKVLTRGQKVYRSLVHSIIPQIQNTLSARTKADMEHKLNQSKHPEDEDIKRIPLAFALVKMLKKLPKGLLDANINNVLMKIITFLKSKAEGIREEARNMLVKIMLELGGDYLKWLVDDLQSILNQGFQFHVLVYTLHAVLHKLRPLLTPSHIDSCMTQMIEICKNDILGIQAEEKEVSQITNKVKEARKDKSYEILRFTAEFISTERLRDIVVPLKEVLAETQDRKVVNKMARCLKEVANGLDRNNNISITHKSIFIYGLLTERLSVLTTDMKMEKKPASKKETHKADSFLLLPEPKRNHLAPKTSFKATAHVLIDFALELLCTLIRRERFVPKETEHISLLDPFIPIVSKCINSEYPEVSMEALKCIICLIRFPLPSLATKLGDICNHLYVILNKFSSPELARGKVYDLVQLAFKTLAAIIKTVETFTLTEDQLKVLLEYVERNLENAEQQQTAFIVLQAIIAKKFNSVEVHTIMRKVKEMSITCSRIFALQQARVAFYTYVLNYPLKARQISFIILYFLGNIAYEIEEGRFSALTMLNAIISKFPVKVFNQKLETNTWFHLSRQLITETSKENRTLLHKALKTLFQRSKRREKLVDLCAKLLRDDQDRVDFVAYQLSARSLSAFLDAPVKSLTPNFHSSVIPLVIKLINPSKYAAQLDGVVDDDEDLEVRQMDTALTHLLEVLTKLVGSFSSNTDLEKHMGEEMWASVQAQLRYPHIQVRLAGVNLVGKLLAAYPVENAPSPKFAKDTERARSLVLDLCELLKTEAQHDTPLLTQLSLSIVRNLIYLIRHSGKVPLVRSKTQLNGTNGNGEEEDVSEAGSGNSLIKEVSEGMDENQDQESKKKGKKRRLSASNSDPQKVVSESTLENGREILPKIPGGKKKAKKKKLSRTSESQKAATESGLERASEAVEESAESTSTQGKKKGKKKKLSDTPKSDAECTPKSEVDSATENATQGEKKGKKRKLSIINSSEDEKMPGESSPESSKSPTTEGKERKVSADPLNVIQSFTDTAKSQRMTSKNSQNVAKPPSTEDNPIVPSAKWVLHRVGNLAYEELQMHGKERTVVREALLNLIAGLVVIIGTGIKTPHIFGYLMKHLARELSDENLPKHLATRTQEVANLIKECVGLGMYTRHLTSAQTALTKKRLQRRANEHQLKAVNPIVTQQKKRKKQEALKESRKRKIAERRGKIVQSKKNKLREQVIVKE